MQLSHISQSEIDVELAGTEYRNSTCLSYVAEEKKVRDVDNLKLRISMSRALDVSVSCTLILHCISSMLHNIATCTQRFEEERDLFVEHSTGMGLKI